MNKAEALQALDNGETLTHVNFDFLECMKKTPEGNYVFEDGCEMSPSEFWRIRDNESWETGWSKEHTSPPEEECDPRTRFRIVEYMMVREYRDIPFKVFSLVRERKYKLFWIIEFWLIEEIILTTDDEFEATNYVLENNIQITPEEEI